MKKVILLTGCINPNGMPFTQLTDICERQKQYVDAIHFYLNNTDFQIVFCENSNTNIQFLFKNEQRRLEILTYAGNQNKRRGKGYGEVEIIEYALCNSSFIKDDCVIIKITGRLIVRNINEIITHKFPLQKKNSIICSFNSDLKYADSRIFYAPVSFFKSFINHKYEINDSKNIFFEHVLSQQILMNNNSAYPFWEEPSIIGVSGSTGKVYCGKDTTPHHLRRYRIFVLEQACLLGARFRKYNAITLTVYYIIYIFHKLTIKFYEREKGPNT